MQILHSFSYSRYVKILKNLTFNRKIELIKINPVYSTKIIVQIWFLVYTYILYKIYVIIKKNKKGNKKMIDYLNLEASLKKFFDYEAQKEHDKKANKIFKIAIIIYFSLLILSFDIFDVIFAFTIFFPLSSFIFIMIIYAIIEPDKNFETDNYETEENLKKVSEFGIKNVTNFKENISLLRRKTEYMILDENFKKMKTYSAKEIYINKILNIFYGTDKTDLKKQDMELLELLKK